jgi:hypothetical protein
MRVTSVPVGILFFFFIISSAHAQLIGAPSKSGRRHSSTSECLDRSSDRLGDHARVFGSAIDHPTTVA